MFARHHYTTINLRIDISVHIMCVFCLSCVGDEYMLYINIYWNFDDVIHEWGVGFCGLHFSQRSAFLVSPFVEHVENCCLLCLDIYAWEHQARLVYSRLLRSIVFQICKNVDDRFHNGGSIGKIIFEEVFLLVYWLYHFIIYF